MASLAKNVTCDYHFGGYRTVPLRITSQLQAAPKHIFQKFLSKKEVLFNKNVAIDR